MNIIHYTFPPYRSGGTIKYSTDLLLAERKLGHVVNLLYPGGIDMCYPKKKIIQNKIHEYKIINHVPLPLLYGVKNPLSLIGQTRRLSEKQMERFFDKTKPDIFHIHTLMGFPYELAVFMKQKNVKIIFTSHDYYGICLKVNFIDWQNSVCNQPSPEKCALCNQNSPSSLFLRLRNSKFILSFKNKLLNSIVKTEIPKSILTKISHEHEIIKYKSLISFYRDFFSLIDCIHFNSTLTGMKYAEYINIPKSAVIPLSHKDIQDHRTKKLFNQKLVRLGFIGSLSVYKGFPMLKEALLKLNEQEISNWSLTVWGNHKGADNDCNRIYYAGKYNASMLREVYGEMDLLIVPSLCNETFSLVTAEALSYGVPVLVSSTVGAKDIVSQYDKYFIFTNESELFAILKKIMKDVCLLSGYNQKIIETTWTVSFSEHVDEIINLYAKTINQ
jgi:glycosyltransferase involved in cell wall biosynthesis